MTAVEREQLLLSLLKAVRPVIAHYPDLDFEELYQDASVWILELIDHDVDGKRANSAYAKIHVNHRIIDKIRYLKRRFTFSLDAPLAESDVCLADLIPSPYSHDPASILASKEHLMQLRDEVDLLNGSHGSAVRSRYETALAAYC